MDEQRILQIMKSLDLTRDETIELLHDDEDIEHDKPKDFDLTAEQKKNAKQVMNGMARCVDAYGKTRTRTVKDDNEKLFLINLMADLLNQNCQDVEITNKQREINFSLNGRKFKIVLSAPRK